MIDRDSTDIPMRRVAAMAASRSAGYPACTVHDAFLSYNQAADDRLAAALEAGLERLAKPLFKLRAIDVFRDKTGMAASPGLWTSLESHLSGSRWLIYLACPESAASPWCVRELGWWLDRRGGERLLIVLTGGELAWHRGGGGLDGAHASALPVEHHARFAVEPLWVDPCAGRAVPTPWVHAIPAYGPHCWTWRRPSVACQKISSMAKMCASSAAPAGLQRLQWPASPWRPSWPLGRPSKPRGSVTAPSRCACRHCRVKSPPNRQRYWSQSQVALQLAAEARAVADTAESRSALLGVMAALPVSRLQQHESAWRTLATHRGQRAVADGRPARGRLPSAVDRVRWRRSSSPSLG